MSELFLIFIIGCIGGVIGSLMEQRYGFVRRLVTRKRSEPVNTYMTIEQAAEYFRTRESLPAPPDSYLKEAEEVLDRHFGKVKN